ncbi:MAG: hypothetical protein Q7R33_02475, partial [Nitrosarchaeum sp.]|nr:hypothetical protein [Nitrosarchaeum sp.]
QQNTVVAQMKNLPVTVFQQVAQGVYSRENTQNNIIFVRITKDTNLQGLQTINVNGRLIKIYISPRKVK